MGWWSPQRVYERPSDRTRSHQEEEEKERLKSQYQDDHHCSISLSLFNMTHADTCAREVHVRVFEREESPSWGQAEDSERAARPVLRKGC